MCLRCEWEKERERDCEGEKLKGGGDNLWRVKDGYVDNLNENKRASLGMWTSWEGIEIIYYGIN